MANSVRAFGHFPLSIGTSLALEGLYALERTVEPSGSSFVDSQRQRMVANNQRFLKSTTQYAAVWVNLETIVRNVIEAYSKDEFKSQHLNDLVNDVFEDIEAIQTLIAEHDENNRELVVFIEDATERKWLFPHAQWKTPTTKAQIDKAYFHNNITRMVVDALLKDKQPLRVIKRHPPVSNDRIIMISHFPHQLFWGRYFTNILLLESHTGMLKERRQWNSKLKGISQKDPMPFNPFTLQVLGDGQLFAGESRVVQKELKALSVNATWTQVTSREKMLSDIKTRGGVVLQEVYNKTMVMF